MAQSIADFAIRSMICAPMIGTEGEAIGVIQIDTMNQKSRFSDEDLEVLAGVASQAAMSLENAKMHEQVLAQQGLERDLELARRMQRALLPAHPPEIPGYCFFDYYQSAKQVGGDYYDYVELPNDRFAVIVGDVAGKAFRRHCSWRDFRATCGSSWPARTTRRSPSRKSIPASRMPIGRINSSR